MIVVVIYSWAAFLVASSAQSLQQKPLIEPSPTISTFSPGLADLDGPREFSLRHIFHHGAYKYPNLLRRLDVDGFTFDASARHRISNYRTRSRMISIDRPFQQRTEDDNVIYDTTGVQRGHWTEQRVSAPDVTDRETVLSFARMALDAYTEVPYTGDWRDVGSGFNYTEDFGWQNDGIRGHVFADTTNKTVVITMKGTSLPFLDPYGTITNDKINDNLLFSCCCAQGRGFWWSVRWYKPCSCDTETNVCNSTCLDEAIREKTRYYYAAHELYHNVSSIYPDANIWLAGHSLGGALASLVGLTVGRPTVTFEAPAEHMAATRLGLIEPSLYGVDAGQFNQRSTGGYHFGHTADDIFMGNCNSWNSICTWFGYAMETKCHTGHICVYDTIKDLNWSSNAVKNHGIKKVIDDVLEVYEKLPDCKLPTNCTDCENWTFETD